MRVVEPGGIELADVPEPSNPALVAVAVESVGICGTDTKILSGAIPVEYPRVLGHEVVGRVISEPGGSPYEVGDRVLVDPAVACGWCDLCRAGRSNICRNGGLLGRDVDGVFTERVMVPVERLVPVPDEISPKASGLLQVLGTCVHAMRTATSFPGQVAAVIGLGVAGQIISQLLSLRGIRVVGITRSDWKRDLAVQNGAHAVSEPSAAASLLDDITSGRGPDIVVEAVGTESTLSRAIELAGFGAEIVVFGTITHGDRGLPYYHLYHKELTLHNPRAAIAADYADGVELAATGALDLETIVSHELDLEQAGHAFELVNEPESMKVLMRVA